MALHVGKAPNLGARCTRAMPPGDYFVAAAEYLETGSERDPELLARLADKATWVTLAEGESKSIRLIRLD